jgi:hypothetical protein
MVAVIPQHQNTISRDDDRSKLVLSILGRERFTLEISVNIQFALFHFHLIALRGVREYMRPNRIGIVSPK